MSTITIKNNNNIISQNNINSLSYSDISGIKGTINNKNNTADKPKPYNEEKYTFGKEYHNIRNINQQKINITNGKKVKSPTNNTAIQIKKKFNKELNNNILYGNNNSNLKNNTINVTENKPNNSNNEFKDINPSCININSNKNNTDIIKSIKENTINNIGNNSIKYKLHTNINNQQLLQNQKQEEYYKFTEEPFTIYTYNNEANINWNNYTDKIYLLHSKQDNQRTLTNLEKTGITDYKTIYYKTELKFKDYKYYKTASFLDAIEDAYNHKYNSIIILRDDIKFIDDENVLKNCLETLSKHDIAILNPDDISQDCLYIKKSVIQFIHNLNIDKSDIGYKINLQNNINNQYSTYKLPYNICLHLIDFVLPFVDCNDPNWQEIHNKYTNHSESDTANRFQSWDNLQYVFKGIEKNAPYIDNIYLIVMCDSQVPEWVNKETINIIYHKDFIPNDKLPCFSSTLIETYMTNIKDISEYFLYSNDDLFIVNRTCRKHWYTNGLPNLDMCRFTRNNDQFARNSIRSWKFATQEFSNVNHMYRTNHSINPMLKSVGIHLHDLYSKQINESASMFRSEKDFNQYIYTDYIYCLCNYELKSYIKTKYVSLFSTKSLLNVNLNKYHVFCPNDCIKNQKYFNNSKTKLLEILRKYINISQSKYELSKEEIEQKNRYSKRRTYRFCISICNNG